jgi:multiple sugar transport system substrate-binding protein
MESIVQEEVTAFFTGDKSAEETAKIIQNRVSIYLSEQS